MLASAFYEILYDYQSPPNEFRPTFWALSIRQASQIVSTSRADNGKLILREFTNVDK